MEPVSRNSHNLNWTFQLPAAGEGAAGLEDYVVEDRAGHRVGTVATILLRGSERYVAVETGAPPARNLRVAPWDGVDVDHDTLVVRLPVAASEIDRLPALDRGRSVEQEDAEATRVADVPGRPASVSPVEPAGPVDRLAFVIPLGCGLLGVFTALVFAIWATGDRTLTWEWALLAVPLGLFVAALVGSYRIFRNPYSG